MNETGHVIVVGAGTIGMLAAIATAREGAVVELWEQNERPGEKLFITGKGRRNVTNAYDMEGLLGSVVSNSKFLYNSFYSFTNQDTTGLLEQAGLYLKVERGDRVLPQFGKSSNVISALSTLLRQAGVRVCLNRKAEGLAVEEGVCRGVRYGGRVQTADRVIVTTGGPSYPTIGSTGSGLKWAADSGRGFTELSPALVPFEVKETEMVEGLQGLSLRNVEVTVYDGKKELYREFREVLFTHFGVSDPVLLSANSFCAKAIRKRPLRLVIDLKLTLPWEQLGERTLKDPSDNRNKQFENALNHLYPSKLIPVIIDRSSIDPGKKVNETAREKRCGLVEAIRALELILTNLKGYREAIITQGGISVKDVSPSTTELKKVQGLYPAGEMLDLDAVTGGLSLQIA